MANKFYEIGKAGGERKTDYSKVLAPAMETMYKQMLSSKEELDASMLNSPQGIAMDKVPEKARTYVTEFLTKGKQKYSQAASVLASGINSSSQRYKDAVEDQNEVQNSFERLASDFQNYNTNVANEKLRVDNIAAGTALGDITDFNNYVSGSIFDGGAVNDDGSIQYMSASNSSTLLSNYLSPSQEGDRAASTFRSLNQEIINHKKAGDSWEIIGGKYEDDYDNIANKLEKVGTKDMVFSDDKYMQTLITVDKVSDPSGYQEQYNKLVLNPEDAIAGYKEHNMTAWKSIYDLTPTPVDQNVSKSKFFDGYVYTDGITGGSAESKSASRKQIDDRVNFGDYDGKRGYYTYNPNSDDYTVQTPPVYSKDGKTKLADGKSETLSVFNMLKREGLLRDGETDPSKIVKAGSANSSDKPAAEPLFPVEQIVSGLSENIFNQSADVARKELEAAFTNIPGFKVTSTERGGVIVKYKGKTIEVMSSRSKNLSPKDAESLSRSRENLIKWLETVAIKPAI